MNLNDLRKNAYTSSAVSGKKDADTTPKSSEKTLDGEGFKKFGAAAAAEILKEQGLVKVPVEEPAEEGKDSVYRRVAKFLLLIGEDEAAKILPHLSEKQIEKIIPEIASIRSVEPEEASVILEEFQTLLENAKKSGGPETAREMLTKAYGEDRANEMLKKAMKLTKEEMEEYFGDTLRLLEEKNKE